MKLFLILSSLIGSTSTYANYCTDFSGDYEMIREVSEQIRDLKIEQTNCDSIVLKYPYLGTETFKLDGKRVKHTEYPGAGLVIYVTPYARGRDVLMDIEKVWSDGKKASFKRRIHFEYGPETRLLDQQGDFKSDGTFVTTNQVIYRRK